jgi:dihydroneopterin aldolase
MADTGTAYGTIEALKIADASRSVRHMFVRDLVLGANIGVYNYERKAAQPVRINIDLTVEDTAIDDQVKNVVDYARVIEGARSIISEGHINLVETLAERIARWCLDDGRVLAARVRIEKLNVCPEAAGVGVEIERFRANG